MSALAGEFSDCRQAFTALGDENRQRIVLALLENYGGMRVGDISAKINLSRPATSHHLSILKSAGIVNMYRRGTMNFYHMDADEALWARLMKLVAHVNDIISDVTEKHQLCQCAEDD